MPQYLSPGVYVEEVASGSQPIEGVGTAVASFVGIAENGPFNEPTLVTNWTQFTANFGDLIKGSYLGHAVYGFFLNGGGAAYIVRIGQSTGVQPKARAELTSGVQGQAAMRATAQAEGVPGNDLSVEIADAAEPADDTFKLTVKRGAAVEETFDTVSVKRGKTNVATMINTHSKLITIEDTKGLRDSASVQLSIQPPSTPGARSVPIAVDDQAFSSGNPVVIDVVANDSDPGGDELAITTVEAPDSISGTVSRLSPRTVLFTPLPGFVGTTRFRYWVTNVANLTASATVSEPLKSTLLKRSSSALPRCWV